MENNKFCQKILKKHWPNVPIFGDIKDYKHDRSQTIQLVSGGFPCQPYSVAGKQKGKEDDRAIWPQMLRVIKESSPNWVLAENVAGIINMELDSVLSDLESENYKTETFVIPACAINARHRRDRVWIVGYSEHNGQLASKINKSITKRSINNKEGKEEASKFKGPSNTDEVLANTNSLRQWRRKITYNKKKRKKEIFIKRCSKRNRRSTFSEGMWVSEPKLDRVAHGVSNRMDRTKALGNAIVPQVARVIFEYIKEFERGIK